MGKLINGKGIKAKIDIPGGTILGQYTGKEYLEHEYEDVFHGSNEYDLREMYAMDATMYIPDDEMTDNELYSDVFYNNAKQETIIIDGWAHKEKNLLIYINDCRLDIDEKIPTAEDEKCWNTCFRTVHVNGYPMVVMV